MKDIQSINILFYIRQNRNIRRDYAVYCCIKIKGGDSKELCISSSIKKRDWNTRKGRPKQTSDSLVKLSFYLETIRSKIFNIYLELKLNAEEISAERIRNIYLGKEEISMTLLQLMSLAIKKYKKEVTPGTLKNYHATELYVTNYCKVKYKSGDVKLRFLTYSFIDGLKSYILNYPIKPNDPCTNNGCMKHIERVKKIAKWAYEMRFMDRSPFLSFKIRKKRYKSNVLTWEQIAILEGREFQRPIYNLVKDLFLFSCYTGMPPVDLQRLRHHQIYQGKDKIKWLSYTRGKSNITGYVPLLTPALDLISKYKWKKGQPLRDTVFPLVSNKDLNSGLKIISEICEIGILINFYVSRHTFASTVTSDVPVASKQIMMAHEKIESTMNYSKTENSSVSKDMGKVQKRIDRLKGCINSVDI